MNPTFTLSGYIGEGEATPDALGRFLDANPGAVDVLINSPGGIASDGAALMAAMQRHGNVSVQIDGIAASAASLVAMGGKRITMHPASLMMIHEPSAWAAGPAGVMRQTADALDKMTGVYAQAYARATGNPVARVAEWMADETWLTAAEALALNFADEIGGDTPPEMIARFDYTRFQMAPAHLLALACQQGWSTSSTDTGKKDKTDA